MNDLLKSAGPALVAAALSGLLTVRAVESKLDTALSFINSSIQAHETRIQGLEARR